VSALKIDGQPRDLPVDLDKDSDPGCRRDLRHAHGPASYRVPRTGDLPGLW
jgi:hypothetical protein